MKIVACYFDGHSHTLAFGLVLCLGHWAKLNYYPHTELLLLSGWIHFTFHLKQTE